MNEQTQSSSNAPRLRFSANLGFLWKKFSFIERIQKAALCGFDALEFHGEAQMENRAKLLEVLNGVNLPIVCLNTRARETRGLAAIPDKTLKAHSDIVNAAEVATEVGAGGIHILSGMAEGDAAKSTFMASLRCALDAFEGGTVLIEPISPDSMPGYFLNSLDQAAGIIDEIGDDRLKIIFDCYHVHKIEGDLLGPYQRHAGKVGHIQIASIPNRKEPDTGTVDYIDLMEEFTKAGYDGYYGCEYNPVTTVENGLSWLVNYRATGRF